MGESDPTGLLERQRRLVEAAYALHTSFDVDHLLGLILQAASDGVEAERGTVYLLTDEGRTLWSRVLSGDEELEIRLPVGQGIAGAVAADGNPVRIDDAYSDPRFDRSWDERSGFFTRQILCAPIRSRSGEIVGVFQLLNKRRGAFTVADEEYLAALSVHAALALGNARLHASALEKERYDREVGLARTVQRQLQPERLTKRRRSITAAGVNELCEDASGDYYDFLFDLPGGRLGVIIGDVSGHGLQAALVMAEARAFLRAFLQTTDDLPRAMDLLNDALVPDMVGGRFLTLFAALIDGDSGAVEWCNAGHNAPLLRRAGGEELLPLGTTGRVMGFLPEAGYGAGAPFVLEPGDVLLLYTDGVTEARNGARELFGEGRLENLLARLADSDPERIVDGVRAAVAEWTRPLPARDDVTVVAVKRLLPD